MRLYLVRPTNGTQPIGTFGPPPLYPAHLAVSGLTGSAFGLSGLVVVVATLGQILPSKYSVSELSTTRPVLETRLAA